MKRNLKSYITISLKGLSMGAADVVPGVSGGTIAFITGIYEELVTTIANVDISLLKTWRQNGFAAMWTQLNGGFIIALLTGIFISIFTVMRLTNYLLDTYPIVVWSFFFGLVGASVWYVGKQIEKWNPKLIGVAILGFIVAFGMTKITPAQGIDHPLYFLMCGAIAVCAMILPGISGAFILVLLGGYKSISAAVSEFNIQVIGLVSLGAVIGLLSFSRILKWLFTNFKSLTLSVLTGFIAGSLNKIWPWKEVIDSEIIKGKVVILKEISISPTQFDGDPKLMYASIAAILGFLLILLLEKIAKNQPLSNAEHKDI
jgi:putative membrane protein